MVQNVADCGRKFVLVVEDEVLLRMMAGDLVEHAGLQPLLAADADEAVRILEIRDDIAIVFTDVHMPGSMDGIRLAAAVRDRWPPIRLIVVSGHLNGDPEIPEGSRYFAKPYVHDDIISALQEFAQ